ncbi:hypothetical protein KPL74_09010 [Bacillus sp. NP157]|nr:hypothetical protein KPL74_09010 [Bacillus sp. NP157]
MPDPAETPRPVILVVALPERTGAALDMVLSGLGFGVLNAPTPRVARRVLAASVAVRILVCRCGELADEDGLPFAAWVGALYPTIGLLCLCDRADHGHDGLPERCRVLSSPFDAMDVARAVAGARLDAFANAGGA